MKKITYLLTAALVISLSAQQCRKKDDKSLKIVGSDTMVQMAQTLAKKYMEKYPDRLVSVQGGGSGTGIAALLNDSAHVANASRKMKDKEFEMAQSKNIVVKEHIVALDALSIVVNPANSVGKLNINQLSDIFAGKVTNWKELGGKDAKIVAISRDNNSGTHVYFKEEVLRKGDSKSELEFGKTIVYAVSNQQIIDQVSANENAISYVGLGWLSAKVKTVDIESEKNKKYIKPSMETAMNGTYPLSRTLQMYSNEAYNSLSGSFMEYVLSDEGQNVVEEMGFVKVKNK